MNLGDVADQIAAAGAAVHGLRCHPRPGPAIAPPALVVGLPERIDYDQAYGRGVDVVALTVFLLVGRVNDTGPAGKLLTYLSGSGEDSVKTAIEAGPDGEGYTAADDVHVTAGAVTAITHNGVEFLGATLDVVITGKGEM